jgi:ABC-2 type transport system ATP-binding protein
VELEDQAGRLIRELSGGQQRRVDLALALAGDPDLVFLDEPTTGFDPAARRRTWAAIRNLADLGKTVLLTTHYLEEAQELAHRVAVVVDGRVVACDSPQRLADRHLARSRVSFEVAMPDASRAIPLVEDASFERSGDRLTISTRDPEEQLRVLLAWARRRRLRLSGLEVSPPSLEDVYLGLVGPTAEEAT